MLRSQAALLLAVLLGAGAAAQEFRATLNGRVSDPSGAAVPGAKITLVNARTNIKHTTETTETGDYIVPLLPPGSYRLEVERAGFRRASRAGIELRVQDRVTIDLALEIGQQSETVTITAETPLLETTQSSIGQVVTQKTIEDTPLNGRNPYALIGLATGALPTGRGTPSFFLRNTATGTTATAEISISGAPVGYNEVLLDGIPTTGDDNGLMYIPSVDATQEFRVQTNSYDAQFGRFLGGVVNATMRSGTNEFHGSAFEFTRNAVWNARDFFATSKPSFTYHQFGVTGGAPLTIPKLYRGKDRTFFFAILDGSREGVPRSFVGTVPTAEQRRGDFSKTLTRLNTGATAPVTIFDPATTRQSGTAFVRTAFPNNIIPSDRLNRAGQSLMQFYPQPTSEGADPATNNQNLPMAFKDPVYDNGYAFKVDHRFSPRNSMFVRYSWRHFYVQGQGDFKAAATSRQVNRYTPGLSLSHTFAMNATTVLNFTYGFTRYRQITKADGYGFDLTTLGMPQSLASLIDRPAIPNVTATGFTTFGSFNLDDDVTETHFAQAALTKHAGRHALRAGYGSRLLRHNGGPGGTTAGTYAFNTVFTRGPNPQLVVNTAGHAIASMLLGLGASGNITYSASVAETTPYTEMYFQDDIRVTSKLAFNFGLRYEWEGAHTERYNRFNRGFDATTPSPIAAQAIANYARAPIAEVPAAQFRVNGGLLFAGVGGQPRGITNIDRNNFSPRVGFAYQALKNTVIRGGYGMFYGATTSQGESTLGFSTPTPWVTTVDGGLTPVDTLTNPFPRGLVAPPAASQGLMTQAGQGIAYVNVDRRQLYTRQFSLSIQQQLPWRMVLEGVYSGTRGGDYPVTQTVNVVPENVRAAARATFLTTGRNVLNDSVANPFLGLISAGTLTAATTTRTQLLFAHPQFTSLTTSGLTIGSGKYDAFDLKASKRFSNGFNVALAYALTKNTETNFFLNPQDTQIDRRLASFDVPQRLTINGSYQLPLGDGRLSRLRKGWQVNFVYAAQSGVPIAITNGESIGRTSALPAGQQSLARWFDTSAFRLRETLERTVTARLGDSRTAGRHNLDLSLFKDTALYERLKLQFRAEAFNVANRAEFGGPDTNFSSATFGRVSSQINFARQIQFGLRLLW